MKIFVENKSRLKVAVEAVYQKDLPEPDLVELSLRYDRSPALRRKFEGFLKLWEDGLKDKLLRPRAKACLLDKESLEQITSFEFEEPFHIAVPAVLTIGLHLEEYVSELMAKGRNVEALLLDTLGSLVLTEAKKAVKELVIKEIAPPLGLCLSEEYYPDARGQDLLAPGTLVSLTNSKESIGVSCLKSGGLHPLKSGVSLFFLAEEAKKISHSKECCDPCMEQKCPYFQIGGCSFKKGRLLSLRVTC